MGSYGRNFEFRIVPETENRLARYATPATGTWVIGSAVAADNTAGFDALGRQIVKQAAASTPPVKGQHGLLLYEYAEGQAVYAGQDPYLTTYSDFSTAPVSKGIQVVSGPNVKVVFRNTDAQTFLVTRTYAARTMVAGAGATPTVAPGDFLEPVTNPSDTAGYWQETSTAANAWLVVTKVDTSRGEVEAMFNF
jgi:hypothetical protein